MSKKYCEKCGQLIKSRRSIEISTHFHAHITQIARELACDRLQVYYYVLLKAIEIEVDGGAPYPYSVIKKFVKNPISGEKMLIDMVQPYSTSNRTNKEMMTAVEAAHQYATMDCHPAIILKEKCPMCKGLGCETCNDTGLEQ